MHFQLARNYERHEVSKLLDNSPSFRQTILSSFLFVWMSAHNSTNTRLLDGLVSLSVARIRLFLLERGSPKATRHKLILQRTTHSSKQSHWFSSYCNSIVPGFLNRKHPPQQRPPRKTITPSIPSTQSFQIETTKSYASSSTKVLILSTTNRSTQSQNTRSVSSWSTTSTTSFVGSSGLLTDESISEEDDWGYFVDHD